MGLWFQRARRVLCGVLVPLAPALAQTQDGAAQELLRQQARERVLREQQENVPDVRLRPTQAPPPKQLPAEESPCFRISRIKLDGEQAQRFSWALRAADPKHDAATGRCLGTAGINVVMARVQNAIVARGFVTTRVLAAPQDINTGTLTLTVVPGRIRAIRFATHTSLKATAWNAVPAKPGETFSAQLMKEATGKDFAPIQNASGHGADLVYIDHATKTIYHVEVKTNIVGQAGGIPEKLSDRFGGWIAEARLGSLKGQKLPPHMSSMADEIFNLRQSGGYKVSHNLMQVEIPRVGRSGRVSAALRPWSPAP
ncbi:MAG: ShlB/FhaC/HecB family hemolysin secretion/activation protein [Alcaligenaceae bacterium]|nr:MAG: ShlB/FhaC/HecB family hemolysin secretion/activation protein [Alcaligenaceae bacterium]